MLCAVWIVGQWRCFMFLRICCLAFTFDMERGASFNHWDGTTRDLILGVGRLPPGLQPL